MPDPITRQYFNGRCTVSMDDATACTLPVPRSCIPRLVGAIDGSEISVTFDRDGNSFFFSITNEMLAAPMERVLWQDPENGRLYLMWNEAFYLKPQAQQRGIGARSIAVELHEIARLGIHCVGCRAVGPANGQIGYYAWPQLGFDGGLEDTDLAQLPAHLAHCRTLNELFLEPGGASHWRRFGRSMSVFFDLAPDSASWRILKAYMDDRGIFL